MYKTKKLLFAFLFNFSAFAVIAQTNTFSPYSRFGFGDIYREGQSFSKGMGGVGVGTRMGKQINFLNPAANTTQDTLSFILDFGFNYNFTKYETNNALAQRGNSDFSHLALSFPVFKWWIASFGATPYSKVGYNLVNPLPRINNIGYMDLKYQGTGGINRYFIGSGFKIQNLSLGINLNYLLGSIEIANSYTFRNTIINPNDPNVYNPVNEYYYTTSKYKNSIRKVYFNFGAQYTHTFNEKISATLGATYEPEMNVTSYQDIEAISKYPTYQSSEWDFREFSYDTVAFVEGLKTGYDVPAKIGLGASVDINNKFLLCFDYHRQDWNNQNFPLSETNLNQNATPSLWQSYNFGVQYIPNYRAIRGYLNHVKYRIGAYYTDTYLKFGTEKIKDYGISCGLGLPFLNSASAFNINYEYGQRGTLNNNLVREKYHFVYVSLTLYDFWFIKSKFD